MYSDITVCSRLLSDKKMYIYGIKRLIAGDERRKMSEEKKFCLECADVIKGRVDKKFCSDACRNLYNNRQKSDVTNYMRNVNNVLRKNRKILEDLTPEETSRASKEKLLKKGFNFQYFTSVITTKKGTYHFCYEYGYLLLENDYYLLVKKKEEADKY